MLFNISYCAVDYVEFADSPIIIMETMSINNIALRRHGYLDASFTVQCKMNNGTAEGNLDFFVAPTVQDVVFTSQMTHGST